MADGDSVKQLIEIAPTALTLAGLPYTQEDLAVLGLVAGAFEPAMRALDEADLAELPLEPALDPSMPPRGREAPSASGGSGAPS